MSNSNNVTYPTSNARNGQTSTPSFAFVAPHTHPTAYCFHCTQYEIRNRQPAFVAAQYRCYDAACCAGGMVFVCGDVYAWRKHMKDRHGVVV